MGHVFKEAPVVRAFIMKQPFLVETNLLQLMSQFLQIIVHLLSSQFLTDKLLKHTQHILLKTKRLFRGSFIQVIVIQSQISVLKVFLERKPSTQRSYFG